MGNDLGHNEGVAFFEQEVIRDIMRISQSMMKCHVVIAGSVNKTFKPWKINAMYIR
ncbi:hypothetical protein YC2023_093910 [Brassica napus]